MTGVVVILTQALELSFPQQPAGIDVNRSEHVPPFDEKPPPNYLWRWSVSMTRQYLVIRRTAEPQKPQWGLYPLISGHHGIGGIAVLMGPIGRIS